ncbi:MAG: hypothetical protein OQK12_09905 [Motiliproteus sp.]|nr:hypothetical protein [Motiliproteus sp.]MCW9051273.1 hypothetical protein [Motiliproteus sp.]
MMRTITRADIPPKIEAEIRSEAEENFARLIKSGINLGDGTTSLQASVNSKGGMTVSFCRDSYHPPGTTTNYLSQDDAEKAHSRLMTTKYLGLNFSNVCAINALIKALELGKADLEKEQG